MSNLLEQKSIQRNTNGTLEHLVPALRIVLPCSSEERK